MTIPVDQLAKLGMPARAVLIVEYLQTPLSLPEISGPVALHVSGYDVRW